MDANLHKTLFKRCNQSEVNASAGKKKQKNKKGVNEQTRRGRGGVNYPFRFLDSDDNHLLFPDKRRGDVDAVNPPL